MPETECKKTRDLVDELCCDSYNSELLRFLARHPHARFNRQALVSGLVLGDMRRIEQALSQLVNKGLIEIWNGNGFSLYWLTQHEPTHNLIRAVFESRGCSGSYNAAERVQPIGMMQLVMPLVPSPALW